MTTVFVVGDILVLHEFLVRVDGVYAIDGNAIYHVAGDLPDWCYAEEKFRHPINDDLANLDPTF